MAQPPRVVVLGAGFGGLTVARELAKAPVRVLLIDRNNYHLFSPLLYQVASALLDPSDIAQPVRRLLHGLPNADFMQAEILRVDLETRHVETSRGTVSYDVLVVATGSETNYFGNATLRDRGYPLKRLEDGLALRNRILTQFEQAEWETDAEARRRLLSIAVVGGGPTGIEFAGAVSELMDLMARRDFRRLRRDEITVRLLEGGDRLLPDFAPNLSRAAEKALTRHGVEVRLGALVESVAEGRVMLRGGEALTAGTVIWTAGVHGAIVEGALPAGHGGGRIPVDADLRLPGHPEVYVIGDVADGLPMLIPVAMQQAKHVAAAIRGAQQAPFEYRDPGIMATIGRGSAVAQVGRLHLTGFLGWVTWLLVHLLKVMTFRARLLVLIKWTYEYLFTDRPIRITVRAGAGPREAPASESLNVAEPASVGAPANRVP